MGIVIPLLLISLSCVIIWKAGDGFMRASEYIGRKLSDGVRGATINAVASSMPEVFISLFFLFILKDAEGFSGGIGTTAGSAIFNGMFIPAAAVLVVLIMKMTKKVHVSRKVLTRDGVALILIELVFLILISGSVLYWYHGLLLMLLYVIYIVYMFSSMDKSKFKQTSSEKEDYNENQIPSNLSFKKSIFTLNLERIFLGSKLEINKTKAWVLLVVSTLCIALVCYILVIACEWIGEEEYHLPLLGKMYGLGVPLMFVALILAAAASSFPDMMLSVKDAKKGRYDDAISNALGSNIFDICFALGFPLFIFTIIHGPLEMPPEIVSLSSELRFLLWLLTVVAVIIFVSGSCFSKKKASLLIFLYFLFVAYIVARGAENQIAQQIADFLVSIVQYLVAIFY